MGLQLTEPTIYHIQVTDRYLDHFCNTQKEKLSLVLPLDIQMLQVFISEAAGKCLIEFHRLYIQIMVNICYIWHFWDQRVAVYCSFMHIRNIHLMFISRYLPTTWADIRFNFLLDILLFSLSHFLFHLCHYLRTWCTYNPKQPTRHQ
jgi:hypothetical protein